ncbi:MAG: SMP-30/gluconolactonase/LRE family protein [Alistipes sp.]|jgi:gluconolactonase|nr:SMP-30/gluconolactonase/LRE family protein [Alistipes sp.]
MQKLTILILIALMAPLAVSAQTPSIIADGAELQKLGDGFSFTEGPAANSRGEVFFTDQPNDKIFVWSEVEGVREWATGLGRSNGMYFDRDGALLSTADAENEIWAIAPDGSHKVLVRKFDDKEFNGPNDLWVHPTTGDIYFTDPLYARPWWQHRDKEMQLAGEHVYLLNRATGKVTLVENGLQKPNGIIGTPDGRTLYVADIGAGETFAYDILPDGSLGNKRFFAPSGSDGMTIDSLGNVYVTGQGVTVFCPAGEQIAQIDVPERWTANVTFGGAAGNLLFITASGGVYGLRMNVTGGR